MYILKKDCTCMVKKDKRGEKIVKFYIRNVYLFSILYIVIPLAFWIIWILNTTNFREVYYIRVAISLFIGIPISIFFNKYGIDLWLAKHFSKKGPATGFDGAIIGSFIGAWITMVPTFTSLIVTNDIEQTKTFIILCWILAVFFGFVIGGFLGTFGKRFLPRK